MNKVSYHNNYWFQFFSGWINKVRGIFFYGRLYLWSQTTWYETITKHNIHFSYLYMDTFNWITSNQQKVIFTNWKYYPLIKTTVTLSRRRVYFFFIFRVRFLGFRSRSRIIFSCKRSSEHFVNNLNLSCVCKLQLSTQIWHSTTRRPSLVPVFGLSHLGYCRNIV